MEPAQFSCNKVDVTTKARPQVLSLYLYSLPRPGLLVSAPASPSNSIEYPLRSPIGTASNTTSSIPSSYRLTSTMSVSASPSRKEPERAFALQKYLLLHSQHDTLQRRLSQMSSAPVSTSGSPSHSPDRLRQGSLSSHSSFSSSSSSPDYDRSPNWPSMTNRLDRSGSMPVIQSGRPMAVARRSSLPTVIDESILVAIEEEEEKLLNVNLQIKTTLTELLNCGSVRSDKRYRMWVQSRLMDAERELKGSRSRSSTRRRSEDVMAGFES